MPYITNVEKNKPAAQAAVADHFRTPPLKWLHRLGFVLMEAVSSFRNLVARQAGPNQWPPILIGPF